MRKTCAAIMGFVHNHPEQLPRVRRYREYYMPTTRKLLNTALGLGESATQNAPGNPARYRGYPAHPEYGI